MIGDLPKNEHVFDVNIEGETTGAKYDGKFTARCVLNMAQKHQLEVERTRLMMDFSNPTGELSTLAWIMAQLRVRITDGPNWWLQSNGGFSISDENVVLQLYKQVMEGESVWKQRLQEKLGKTETPQNSQ